MNIVDSSAWLEYFADTSRADLFAEPVEDVSNLLVPTIILTEVFKRILQQKSEDEALRAVAHMQQGAVVDLDAEIAIDAARLGHKLKLPLADSIILANARKYQATIWTQDAAFCDLEDVNYFEKK